MVDEVVVLNGVGKQTLRPANLVSHLTSVAGACLGRPEQIHGLAKPGDLFTNILLLVANLTNMIQDFLKAENKDYSLSA